MQNFYLSYTENYMHCMALTQVIFIEINTDEKDLKV